MQAKQDPNVARANRRRQLVKEAQPGRNAPCYCGSGLKFKKCCGSAQAVEAIDGVCQQFKGSLNLDLVGG